MFLKLPQKAFSLVELMVVISIIGIITAVSLGSLSTIQKNNRDSQRQSDLRLIQGALQQYYADANHYPDTLSLTAGTAFTCAAGSCGALAKTYLSTTPKDPITGTTTPYYYCSQTSSSVSTTCSGGTSGKCHYYALCATLENPAVSTSCTCGGATSGNFRVNPL